MFRINFELTLFRQLRVSNLFKTNSEFFADPIIRVRTAVLKKKDYRSMLTAALRHRTKIILTLICLALVHLANSKCTTVRQCCSLIFKECAKRNVRSVFCIGYNTNGCGSK